MDDRIVVPEDASLDFTTAFTLSAWVKIDTEVTRDMILISRANPAPGFSYGLFLNSLGWPQVAVGLPSGLHFAQSVTQLPLHQWTHLAATFDGTTLRLFINGELRGIDLDAVGTIEPSADDVTIGSSSGYHFSGALDEVRLYDSALSVAEILGDMRTPVDPATPLQITAMSPPVGAIGVRSQPLSASFGAVMDAATITASTVRLTTLAGTAVSATLSYDATTRTATLTPAAALTPLTEYRITVSGGAEGVASAAASTLPADASWTFKTSAASLIATWSLNEGTGTSVSDSSGNGNHGIGSGAPSWTTGPLGNALTFDGVDDGIEVLSSDTLNPDRVTMAAWIKLFAQPVSGQVILDKQLPFATVGYALLLQPGAIMAYVNLSNGDQVITTVSGPFPLNEWLHLAATYDGTALKIFLNGQQVASENGIGSLAKGTAPLRIGSFPWSGNPMAGGIDDIRLYDRALTPAEIVAVVATPSKATQPTFSVASGTYVADQTVVVTGDNDSTIHYTRNGSVPTESDPTVTSGESLLVDHSQTLSARAFKTGSLSSETRSAVYTMKVGIPLLSPVPGMYADPVSVSIASLPGVTWRYTTDGTTPTASSSPYSSPLPITPVTTLRVVGVRTNWTPSDVGGGIYTSTSSSGLRAAWGFEDGPTGVAIDTSGYGHTGTLMNGLSRSSARIGTGLHFDGADDQVVVPQSDALDFTTGLTMSAWVKLDADITHGVNLISRPSATTTNSFALQINSLGWVAAAIGLPSGLNTAQQTTRLPANQWTHVAATFDGSSIRLYLNGELVAINQAAIGSIEPSNGDLTMGSGSGYFLPGSLDEVRLYDRALSLTEILDDMTRPVDPATPLEVTAVSPRAGELSVRSRPISATFGGAMEPSSISTSTLRLETASGTTVPASVSYDAVARTATLSPANALAPLTEYRITVVGGAQGVTSLLSTTLANDLTWTFRTATAGGIGSWSFDDGSGVIAADSSGNGNHGAVVGGAAWIPGAIGQALSFDGLNDGVEVPNADILNPSGDLTIAAWLKLLAQPTGYSVIVAKQRSLGGAPYSLTLNPGAISATLNFVSGDVTVSANGPFPLNEGLHVAATYDGAMLRLYLNGQIVATHSGAGIIANSSGPVRIGSYEWSNQLSGAIDEVRLYDSALTPTDIAMLATRPAAPTVAPATATYTTPQLVTISTTTANAVIRYTTDGTDPTDLSPAFNAGLVIDSTTTLKARAFDLGWLNSAVTTRLLTINPGTLATPVAAPGTGWIGPLQRVTLVADPGTEIRYTLDGTEPTSLSALYATPVAVVADNTTLRARAFRANWTTSAPSADLYRLDTSNPSVVAQQFPPPRNGWQVTPVTVTFTCADDVAIATCSAPVTVSTDGNAVAVMGTAVDGAGNEASIMETVKLDRTPPVVELTSPIGATTTTAAAISITGTASDALSGLSVVKCNGVNASVESGVVTCSVDLRPGRNDVVLSAVDAAGNSTSASVTVMRGSPTTTSISMSPTERHMMVGETATVPLRDTFGMPVTGAEWISYNPDIVSLSNDDPPIFTAVTPGFAWIEAGLNDNYAAVGIFVDDEEGLPLGATKWQSDYAEANLSDVARILTHRIDAEGPDFFRVMHDANTDDYVVRPYDSDTGSNEWLMTTSHVPLMGDAFGGLIAAVQRPKAECIDSPYYVDNCYTALVRLGGPPTTAAWRYESRGYLDRPAVGPDGTIYAVEHVEGASFPLYQRFAVMIDGTNGKVTARIALPNGSQTLVSSTCPWNNLKVPLQPHIMGPMVNGDGFGYLLHSKYDTTIFDTCTTGIGLTERTFPNTDTLLTLIKLSKDGSVAEHVLDAEHYGASETAWFAAVPYQLLPDGMDGVLVTALHKVCLIRFGGHLPKGGYDVPNGEGCIRPASPAAVQ